METEKLNVAAVPNLKDLQEAKRKELEALNRENSRIEQYRLDIMSQIIRVTGQLDLLTQLIKEQEPKPEENLTKSPSA